MSAAVAEAAESATAAVATSAEVAALPTGDRCAHRCQPMTLPPGRPCTGSGGACMKRL